MKITVNLSKLTAACKLASDVADRRGVMQALACAKLTVSDKPGDMLTISATDLTTSALAEVGGRSNSGAPGSIAIDAQELSRAVASFGGEDAALAVDEKHRLTIVCDKARITLPGASGADMPKMPDVDRAALHELDAREFSEAASRTIYAAGVDLSRWHLTGVSIDTDGAMLKMFGCNGQRLATQMIHSKLPKFSALVPSRGMARIVTAPGEAETARVGLVEDFFHVATEATVISVKVLREKRMPFEQVIEKKLPGSVVVSRAELLAAIRLAALVAPKSKDLPDGAVDMAFEKDSLSVSSDAKHAGTASTTLDLKATNKHKATILMSSAFMIDALTRIETDDVELMFLDTLTQLQLRAPGSETGLHLIMPRHG